jgi:hypothetical protein
MTIVILFVFAQGMWIETTPEDFADGIFERNIYASHFDGGTIEFVPRFDLNNDGYIDLFTADEHESYVRIYWGSTSGYSPSNLTLFPTLGASNCDAADLNGDGYSEFLVTHQIDPKFSIYWGSPTGPNSSYHFDIPTTQQARQGIFVADFDKDGYLDIATSQTVIPDYGAIFWGDSTGYDINRRTDLPVAFGVHNIEVADLNKDNWLDVLFVEYYTSSSGQSTIYWGSSTGFSPSNYTLLPGPGSFGASVADLNKDKYLDLILTTWYNTQSYIYWGDTTGYSSSNMQTLNPGSCYGGSAVADINADNYLDIIFHRGGYGYHHQEIYWGSATGYSDNDTSWFGIPLETTGGFIADLNFDGDLDVFCNTISPGSESYIFWGPSFITNTALPVNKDHEAMFREIGNVYNREYYEDYISSVFDAGEEVNWGIIEWYDSLPPETAIFMYVRSGNTPAPDSTWSTWDSLGNGDEIADSLNSQYLQYRARLTYTNPAYLPYLYEVRIAYSPAMKLILQPDQADSTLPAVAVAYDIDVINIGIGLDTVDLAYLHNTSWQIQLFDSSGTNLLIDHNTNGIVDIIIGTDDTIGIVLEILPPLGAQGGEVDTLILTGSSNIIPDMADSVLIYTSIQRLVNILVDPDQIEYTPAGTSVTFDLWVINRGTNHDTVDLYYTHNQPWGVSLLDSAGTSPLTDHNNNGLPDVLVNSYDSVGIIAVVYPPGTAQQGQADTLLLTGQSTLNPAVTDNATLITVIEETGAIIVFPNQTNSGQPDTWVSFPLTCRNTQAFVDTIDIALFDQLSWSYNLLDSLGNPLTDHNSNGFVDLPGISAQGGEVDFSAEVHIPSGTPSGTIDSILLFAYSGKDSTIQDSSILVLNVGDYALVLIQPDCADSGNYNDTIDYRLYVQNLGNNTDIIDLTVFESSFNYSLRDINGNPLIDTNNNGMVDLGPIPAYSGESLLVRTRITSSQYGFVDTATVRAISSINPAVYDDAQLKTRVLGGVWGLILEPDQETQVEAGHSVRFPVDALLEGSVADVVDIELDAIPADWSVTLLDSGTVALSDTDYDGLVDLGVVVPDVSRRFYVVVSAPQQFSLIGPADTLVFCAFYVHGRCSIREDITDSVLIQVQLVPPFDVHNFCNPFHTQTQFIFSLPKDGRVTLEIYNRVGELVRRLIDNQSYFFGVHYYPWNGANHKGDRLAPGTYIYILDFRANDGDRRIAKKKAVILE